MNYPEGLKRATNARLTKICLTKKKKLAKNGQVRADFGGRDTFLGTYSMKHHIFFMEIKSCFVNHLFHVGALPAWEGVVQALLR